MRHRRIGRSFGRSSSHRAAMFRNLASSLILTEREADDLDPNAPKVKGRVITTMEKAKEARRLIERTITVARRALPHLQAAEEFGPGAARGTDAWKQWRTSQRWQKWNQAMAPVVAARRKCLRLLGDKQAVRILFSDIAPRFADRPGGYTRVLRLPKPRLGDAGTRAILEFVGVNDRVITRSQKPAFDTESSSEAAPSSEST